MKLITNEYTTIYNKETGKERKILPGVEFEPFKFEGVVTAYALIKDVKTNKGVFAIQPGQMVKGIGETIQKESAFQSSTVKELKEMAITKGITIKAKSTKAELIALLEG